MRLVHVLQSVNCLGACALAPLVVVDGLYHGQMNETKANAVLEPVLAGGDPTAENEREPGE